MLDKIKVAFDEKSLGYREKADMMAAGVCKGIFPLSLIKTGEKIIGFYQVKGYKRLSECKKLNAEEVLTVVEKTIAALQECESHLIFAEEILLSRDTVYIREDFNDIRFTYFPDKTKIGARRKLTLFIAELKDMTTDNGCLYLDMLGEMIAIENADIAKIKMFICRLKKEVRLCGAV